MTSGWLAACGYPEDELRRAAPSGATLIRKGDWAAAAWGSEAGVSAAGARAAQASAWVGDQDAGSRWDLLPDGRIRLESDPFGLHAAYWATTERGVVAGSHATAVAAMAGSPHRLAPEAVASYLCFSCLPAPLTAFDAVRRANPGSRVLLDRDAIEEAEWRWEEGPPARDPARAVEDLRDLLRQAVRRRLGARSTPAVFLSGGLDSSIVASLLAQEGARPLLIALDFGPPHDAELPLAWRVADHLGLPLHVAPCRPADVRRALEATALSLEAPFGDPVTVPLWLLGEAAARLGATDVFNGEGGDQVFGGWTNKPMVAAETYAGEEYDREAEYLATFHRFHARLGELLTPAARERLAGWDAGAWLRPLLRGTGYESLLHRLRATNLAAKGAHNIAPRARMLAEAHGLRLRCPFFDRDLARWSFGLPGAWILEGSCEKALLKRAAEPWLPAEIVWREKRGMGAPATEWCLGALRSDVRRRLHPRRLRREGWFRPEFVRSVERGEDEPGEYRSRRLGEKLWLLWFLQVWRDVRRPAVAMPM